MGEEVDGGSVWRGRYGEVRWPGRADGCFNVLGSDLMGLVRTYEWQSDKTLTPKP